MNFNNIAAVEAAGFKGFKRMSDLFSDNSMIPDASGIYMVLRDKDSPVEFLEEGTGGYFKGKNPNVLIAELEKNWVDNTIVVYIGKATSLKKRLRQYFRFGQGKRVAHWGGRLIWQLKDSADLTVCWTKLPEDMISRNVEADLIQQFKSIYGTHPFANLQD